MALQLQDEMNNSLNQLKVVDPVFQRKALFKIKKNIISQLDDLNVSDETKSYILHQLSNVHSANELAELFHDIKN